MPKLRTKAQNSLMHGKAAKLGLTHEDLQEWTFEITAGRTEHTSELYYSEAVKIISRLDSYVNPKQDQTPRRTVNYRRAKAGVVEIISAAQRKYINDLLTQRDISPEGYRSLCFRMFRHHGEPRTTKEAGKVIEALKAMNERDAKRKSKIKDQKTQEAA